MDRAKPKAKYTKDTPISVLYRRLRWAFAKRKRCGYSRADSTVYWIDWIRKALVEALSEVFEGRHVEIEVSGPMGLGSHISVAAMPLVRGIHTRPWKHVMLSFSVNPVSLAVVDYGKDTGEYEKGTIGEINGFNHPKIYPPKDATLEWFAQQME